MTSALFTPPRRTSGYFRYGDSKDDRPKYGNWGSRPYEYAWTLQESDVVQTQTRVLDLGCGPPQTHTFGWWFTEELCPQLYLGIDYDHRMQEETNSRPGFEEYLYGDFTELPLKGSSFDRVLFLSVQEHLTTEVLKKTVSEISRVLKPDGKVLITMDEVWDIRCGTPGWNELEKDLPTWIMGSSGPSSLTLKKVVDMFWVPEGFKSLSPIPEKGLGDKTLVHSPEWNCCVSYCVLEKDRT